MGDITNDSYDYLFKLLCIGESNVGKTTFLHQYMHDTFSNFSSTVGIDVLEKHVTLKDNQRILVQLWDTAGQERYRSLTTSLYRNSMGFLLLFDVTNESSFLSIRNWLTSIDNFTTIDNSLRPPVLLIGNKIDLVTERTIDTIRAQQLANELGITYIEASAVTGTNVQDTLQMLIEQVFHFMDESMNKYYPKPSLPISIEDNQNQNQRKNSINIIGRLSHINKSSCSCT